MAQSGRQLRAELARILNERELLIVEVDRLRYKVEAIQAAIGRLQETHARRTSPPWLVPSRPSNVVPFKRRD